MTRSPTATESDDEGRAQRIRELNDNLRRNGGCMSVMVSSGVAAFGVAFTTAALSLVAAFDSFEPGNDPYGEHDFGLITHRGQHMFWKIEYYDASLSAAAEDPCNARTCTRVLTLMLTSEY